jgi:tRNA (guanosine-2'-O-)-methyltransferase
MLILPKEEKKIPLKAVIHTDEVKHESLRKNLREFASLYSNVISTDTKLYSWVMPPRQYAHRKALFNKIKQVNASRCNSLICVLENPHNSKNIGCMIRNAEGFGVGEMYVVTPLSKKKFKKKMIQGSVGAHHWLSIRGFETTKKCFDYLKQNGYTSIVTSSHAQKGQIKNISLEEYPWNEIKNLAIWFGSETYGISHEALERSKTCAVIRMFGMTESFNLACAGAIALHWISTKKRIMGVAASPHPAVL